jgi:coenzyme PQQ synthesis protein D (PqqD)
MPPISLEHTFLLSRDAVCRELDGEAVILDLSAGIYFGLNAVGTRMWQLIDRHGNLQIVFDELCREYDVAPDVLERDLLALVGRLADSRLGEVKLPA